MYIIREGDIGLFGLWDGWGDWGGAVRHHTHDRSGTGEADKK